MESFVLNIPTEIHFGANSFAPFIDSLKKYRKPLIVLGGGSVKRLGYLSQLTEKLPNYVVFEGIEPNPLASTIDRATKLAREEGVDCVIGFGGGSVMDAAKAIAAMVASATSEDSIWDYVLGSKKAMSLASALPIVAIPTTAATASEVTPFSVISNPETKGKSILVHEFIKPRVAYINPDYTLSLGVIVTADGAADILSHVFENYLLGGISSKITDRYCEAVIATVMETLPQLLAKISANCSSTQTVDPDAQALRSELMWSSTLALCGIQMAGRPATPFVLHAIEHSMSGENHKLAHGRGLASLYIPYLNLLWERDVARDKISLLSERVAKGSGRDFIDYLAKWLTDNNLIDKDYGIKAEQVDNIAKYCLNVYNQGQPIPLCETVNLSQEDIATLVRQAINVG